YRHTTHHPLDNVELNCQYNRHPSYYSPSVTICRPQQFPHFPYTTLFRSISARAALRANFLGYFLAAITPFASGGGPLQVYSLTRDRKSTRLNSSHVKISYAVFCLKKKKTIYQDNI